MIGRTFSGGVVLAYLIFAWFGGGGEALFKMAIFLIFPLACIWFSEAIGDYTGSTGFGKPAITQTTPGCLVAAGGWFLLLLPVVAVCIAYLTGSL